LWRIGIPKGAQDTDLVPLNLPRSLGSTASFPWETWLVLPLCWLLLLYGVASTTRTV
jgi:hypothetical protein